MGQRWHAPIVRERLWTSHVPSMARIIRSIAVANFVRVVDLACWAPVVEWPNARPAAVGRPAVLIDGRRLRGWERY